LRSQGVMLNTHVDNYHDHKGSQSALFERRLVYDGLQYVVNPKFVYEGV